MRNREGREAGWLRKLTGAVMVHRRALTISFAAALLGSVGQALTPLVARHIVDSVVGHATARVWPWLVLLSLVAVVTFGLTHLRRYYGGKVALEVQYDLRNAMHDHLIRMDQGALSHMSTGQLVSRASSDSTLVQGLLNFIPMLSGNLLMMVVSLVIMIVLSPLLAVVGLVIAPALFFVSYRMRTRVFPASWDGQQREGEVAGIVDEDVTGVRVVKAFGQEHRELLRMVDTAQDLYGARMRTVRLQARFQPLLETIPVLAQVAVLALGGWLALRGNITLGTFLAFSTYVAQFVAPARQIAGVLTVGQQARAGVERIFELLEMPVGISDALDAVELPAARGLVEFRDVSFGYDDTPVLDGLDLRIEPGERVAVVGSSGSGKSTLAAMVLRLQDPDHGTVLIDGHDLRTVTLTSLRTQVAMAFEDSFLFSDSIRANIAYGRPDATDAEIEAAARVAAAHEFILDLPHGYETTVGERGLSLSGGQRQRVALARAVLADPAVLVLDDATSAVDPNTEESIFDALREVLRDRSTLLVAHRVSTLNLADRVVLLDKGKVADSGSHEDLIARSATYRALLTGIEDDAAAQISESIEELSAWTAPTSDQTAPTATVPRAGALGPGLGRGGGGAWRLNLAPTPELLAQVAALPPVRDRARIDLEKEAAHDPHFGLGGLIRAFRGPLALGLLLVILDALAGLLGPVLVKTGVDDGVVAGSGQALFWVSAAYLLITLVDLLDQTAATFVTGRTAERIMLGLRIRIWAQLQRLSLDYYERELGGRIMTRMTSDVDQFESLMENGFLNALVASATFVGVGVALLSTNLELGLWTLSVIIPLAFATVIFRRITTRLYDVVRERLAAVNADFQESLSGVREAQSFVHEDRTIARFHSLGRSYFDGRLSAQRTIATYFPFVQFLSAIAEVIVLGVGARLIEEGHLSTGALIAFILYISLFFSPIQQLSQVFDAWQQTRVSVGRIAGLMALDTLTPEPEQPAVLPATLRGSVDLEDIHFCYPGRPGERELPEALAGLSLTISPGETLALVGETGAGKSTVLKLIARFYDPDAGSVRLDDHDLRSLALRDFRSRLGYVPQESFLFSGTLRDNIAYGRPEATDAEVEAAARAVGAHSFVAGQPGGYFHEVSERGKSLSAGQRQLIALARAELVDPTLLLLDEATANLDLLTERRVNAAMAALSRRRTTVLIAHRIQTARTADRIALVANGRIAESGSHDELVALGGRYAAMWKAFSSFSGGR